MRSHGQLPDLDEDGDYRAIAGQAGKVIVDQNRKNDRYAACVRRVIEEYAKAK